MIVLTTIIIYPILYVRLKRDLSLLKKVIKINDFENQIEKYTGFIIFTESDLLSDNPSFFGICMNVLSKKQTSNIVDISNGQGLKKIEYRWLKKYSINVLPTIVSLENGIIKEKIISFNNNIISFPKKKLTTVLRSAVNSVGGE
ncbi:hypothetical protein D3C87_902540 [compost metagenome]